MAKDSEGFELMPVQPTILNAVTGVSVADADALVTDVKDPKTFYAVAAPRKTGTMPTVAILDNNPAYPAGYHAGAASLAAVDAHLAVGNIKNGVSIFGVAGTYAQTLAEDIEGYGVCASLVDTSGTFYCYAWIASGYQEITLATKTQTYGATSLAFAAGFACIGGRPEFVLRLYMGGVLLQSEATGPYDNVARNHVLKDFKSLSGSQECKLTLYNNASASNSATCFYNYNATGAYAAAIAAGSVKLV